MAEERNARNRSRDERQETRDESREDRADGPRRDRADAEERASPVPGPGTEGAEEGYHSMHAPEERRPDDEPYNVAPPDMPPSGAGANAEDGGEAAASRRTAGLPPELARRSEHRPDEPTPGREPFLGYDGYSTTDVLGWIIDADPEAEMLEQIHEYENMNRRRDPILQECEERLRRLGA